MKFFKVCMVLCAAVLTGIPAQAAFKMDLRSGDGVTASKVLSDYNPNLKDSDYDTAVYVLKGNETGGKALILSGTHAREIGGVLTAAVLLENVTVEQGTLFVIPCLNAAGMSVPDSLGQVPHQVSIKTQSGMRSFAYGDRYIPLRAGESDPPEFRHPKGYVHKDGREWRNINRNYPGIADGTPAQRVAFAVMELIRTEGIETCLDMHEATAPEEVFDPRTGKKYPGGTLSYSLVTHPKYGEIAAEMLFDLEDYGALFKLELSDPSFRGISHFEIAENTECIPFLSETPNPAQHAHSTKKDPLHDPKHPIEERVGYMMDLLRVWFDKSTELNMPLRVSGLPTRQQIQADGLGHWLK